MATFELTEVHKKAIEIFELAGYVIKIGETDFHTAKGIDRTFGILKDGVKLHGCSSTYMLTPAFAIRTLHDHSFKKGYEKGQANLQNDLKKLLNIS